MDVTEQLSHTAVTLEDSGVRFGHPRSPWVDSPPRASRARVLTSEQAALLIDLYLSGVPLAEIAAEVGCDRSTVNARLRAAGVSPKRYTTPTEEELQVAVASYEAGSSLVEVAHVLGVHRRTVRRLLVERGIEIRPRRGWIP